MNAKSISIIIVFSIVLGVISMWLFWPAAIPVMGNVWVAVGRPGVMGRLGYLAIFGIVILVLAIRLGKSGPY